MTPPVPDHAVVEEANAAGSVMNLDSAVAVRENVSTS